MRVDERLDTPTDSEREWLRVRHYLTTHRFELGVAAADDYPGGVRVACTPLLADRRWLPARPLKLGSVHLELDVDRAASGLTGRERASESVRPLRADGTRYATYSDAVLRLAAPAVFNNLPTYRLLDADLAGLAGGGGLLVFGRGRYFDGVDVGEACAHEYAGHTLVASGKPLRAAVGEPWNLAARSTNVAVSTLTLRVDRAAGTASFLLHRRDPAKVGHAGGLHQVVPVGVFQPSSAAPWNERNDFDLWRSMIREFSEELLGNSEDYDSDLAPIDYGAWPLAARLNRALDEGQARAFVLGMGTDPLTFATDLLCVAVFDAPTFDEVFGAVVADNDEGRVVSTLDPDTDGDGPGIAFNKANVDRLVQHEPMQAAGAALLALAWDHRDALLATSSHIPATSGHLLA